MADDRIEISISADTKGFTKGLDSATTRLTTLNTKITSTSRNLNTLQSRMSGLGVAIATSTSGFSNFTRNFNAINAGMASLAASHHTLAQSAVDLGNRLNSVRPSMNSHAQGARQAASSNNAFTESFKSLTVSALALKSAFSMGVGIFKAIAGGAIEANAELERTQVLLTGLSNGTTDGARKLQVASDLDYIYDTAKKIPVSIKSMQESFIRFKAVGLDPRSIQGLYDVTGHFGGTDQNIQHSRLAIAEMMEGGKIQMRQLRMLSMTGGIASANQDVAEAAGFKGVNQLFAAMKKGAVNAQDVIPKLLDNWEKRWAGSAMRMANTWTGLTTLLKSNWQIFLAQTMQDDTNKNGDKSLFNTVKKQAIDFIDWLQSGAGKDFASKLWQQMAGLVNTVSDVVKKLWDYKDVIGVGVQATMDLLNAVNTILGALSPYKDQINFIAQAYAKWLEYRLVIGMISGIGNAATSAIAGLRGMYSGLMDFVGILRATPAAIMAATSGFRAWLSLIPMIASVSDAVAVLSLGFQGLVAATGGLLVPVGLLAVALGGLYFWIKATNPEHANWSKTTKENAEALRSAASFTVAMTEATKNTTFATEAAKNASIARVKALYDEVDALQAKAHAEAMAADAKLQNADRDLADAKRKVYNPRIVGTGSMGAPIYEYVSQADRDRVSQAQTTKDQALRDRNDKMNVANSYWEQKRVGRNYLDNAPNISVSEKPEMGDLPTKPNTKLDNAREAERNRYTDLMFRQAEDKYKLANNGEGFDPDTASDTRASLFEQSKGVIDKYFDSGNIQKAKEQIANLFASIKAENANLEKQIRVQNIFRTFDASIQEAQAAADEAFGAIFDNFKTMDAIGAQKLAAVQKARAADRNQVLATGDDGKLKLFDKDSEKEATLQTETEAFKRAQTLIAADKEVAKAFQSSTEQEQQALDDKKKEINDLIKYLDSMNASGKYDKEIAGLRKYSSDLDQQQKVKSNPLAVWGQQQADIQKNTTQAIGNSLTGWFDQLAEGKANFAAFAESIVSDLSKIIIKALIARAVMGALGMNPDGSPLSAGSSGGSGVSSILGAVGKGISSLFGGSSAQSLSDFTNSTNDALGSSMESLSGMNAGASFMGGFSDSLSSLATIPDVSDVASVGLFHSGGRVGGSSPLSRHVDPGIFSFAKRYHTGGFPGLKKGEVPIIAKKGEGVFTEEQMSALGKAGASGGNGGMAPVVNVTNNTSAPVDTSNVKTNWDGEKYVTDIILKAGQKPGPMRDLLRTR